MTQAPETSGPIGFLTASGLLGDLFSRKATGQLVAYRGETIKKVFCKSGFILYATSNDGSDRLGDVLLARGMITRDQYEESASQVLATGRKQGTVLVQIGALTPKDLFRGLIAQVRQIVVSLFDWDAGNWRLLEGLPPQDEIVSLRLHPVGLLFEGLVRTAADPRWADVWNLQRLQLHTAANAPFIVEELDLPDTAKRLLSLVEQGRPPQGLFGQVDLGEPEAAALLYGLALVGLIEGRPGPALPVATAEPPAQAAAATAATAEEKAAAAAAAAAEQEAAEEQRRLREKVVALAGRLHTLSHYQLLGLTPESDAETIKRTYIALAKEYHPDHFFRPEFEQLQEHVNAIFMGINEAYTTLHNPTARAEYDRDVLHLTAPTIRLKEPAADSHLAQEQFTKGLALLNAGDIWSSIQALRWAVNLSPQSPRYQTWLGVALMRTKKRLHEAEEHCKTAIALDYNNPQYYVNLGQVYRTGHLFDKARKQFEQALQLDPKHPGALKELRELEQPHVEKGIFDRLRGK